MTPFFAGNLTRASNLHSMEREEIQGTEFVYTEVEEAVEQLPQQEEFWRPPVRFGTVPVEKEPLGWDRHKGFRKLFPTIRLPFQIVERVSFGNPELEPNRLIWGDNLHIMRQLPSESIDLIYIDPPFFSGRQYNIIFGDQNEVRSFSDIWEGGMPGYLIWLNARLYEMKRLLKKTGSIYVHCDWHASHYIKVEMDKIFGYENFGNEIVWSYQAGAAPKKGFGRKHDVILRYVKSPNYYFDADSVRIPYSEKTIQRLQYSGAREKNVQKVLERGGKIPTDVWEIASLQGNAKEYLGYPTQKPEALLERIIKSSCPEGGVVADFFCGGGTTPAVAQRLGRRWIACDQSRVAIAVTADRLARGALTLEGRMSHIPDFTLEYWGVYETKRLTQMPEEPFRKFVLVCFGAREDGSHPGIHGYKGSVPVWVCSPDPKQEVTHKEVVAFANAIRRTPAYQQANLRDGIMLAWAFTPEAQAAADQLRERQNIDVNFVRLDLIRIDSPRFREHVASLSTDHADYENFLTFVQAPRVQVGYKRIAPLTYKFDISDTIVTNLGAKIINVQFDFNYDGKRFVSTEGYALRGANTEITYKFPSAGVYRVACRVQDDKGGDGMWVGELKVE